MRSYRTWLKWGYIRSKSSRFVKGRLHEKILQILGFAIPTVLLICIGLVIYEFGFRNFWRDHPRINFWLSFFLTLTSFLILLRLTAELFVKKKRWTRILNFLGLIFVLFITFFIHPAKIALTESESGWFVFYKLVLYGGVLLAFVTEASYYLQFIYRRNINPGVMFVGSFGLLVLIGAFLLKLPNATYSGISALEALFTSTSAVCVTGLIVVDTATAFTPFGQLIIMMLIQVGGLGIMTFAGLLAYAVAGHTSLQTQFALKDMMSSKQVNNIMHFVYQVVVVTIIFEIIGAVGIYFTLDNNMFDNRIDKLFFSVFHSISAFCNAGFSTLSDGLHQPVIRFNYTLHFLIAMLVILGGLGFPIVFNLYRYFRTKVINIIRRFQDKPGREHFPGLTFVNARLAILVSILLLLTGFVAYLIFEQSASLKEHPTLTGKLVTGFFGSVTPRTAGFNTVDLSTLTLPTIMIYLLLMWIGASPGSTGGGIKTTTFGVAILNMASIVRGKDRTEFHMSEISHQTVRRAFAIIVLSLLFIGVAIFLVSVNDSEKGLISIAFEVFSAFSTVGLTLGITAKLSAFSKIVLIVTMFAGRVGMLTLIITFIKQSKALHYRYPREDIAF